MKDKVNWDDTIAMEARLEREGKIFYRDCQPHFRAYQHGICWQLPIIHQDSGIISHVSIGAAQREAIFVSPYSNELYKLKQEAKNRVMSKGIISEDRILESIYDTVYSNLPSDKLGVKGIVKNNNAKYDGLISLDKFIRENAGVCRHQSLACGALIELFENCKWQNQTKSALMGKASIDRNTKERNGVTLGRHCWVRYTKENGTIIIFDVASRFFGILNDCYTQKLINDGILWPYNRPADKF